MKTLILLSVMAFAAFAHAEENFLDAADPAPPTQNEAPAGPAGEERDPAAAAPPTVVKRVYPGAADEDDLQVQARLPDATQRIDARSVQREVFKNLYNQELKDDNRESVEE